MAKANSRDLCLIGPRGSGKDTIADHLVRKYGYERFSFGDRVRRIAKEFGIDHPVKEQLVSITDMGYQLLGNNVWINLAIRDMDEINKPIVITDMRYPDIYEYFFLARGFFPVYIHSLAHLNHERVVKRDGRFPDKLSNDQSESNLKKFTGFPIFNMSAIEDALYEIDEMMNRISDEDEFNQLTGKYAHQYRLLKGNKINTES